MFVLPILEIAIVILLVATGPASQMALDYLEAFLDLILVGLTNVVSGTVSAAARARLRRLGWIVVGTMLFHTILLMLLILSIYAETNTAGPHRVTALICGILVFMGLLVFKPMNAAYQLTHTIQQHLGPAGTPSTPRQFTGALGFAWLVIGPAALGLAAVQAPGLLGATGQVILLGFLFVALVWNTIGDLKGWHTTGPHVAALVLMIIVFGCSSLSMALPWDQSQNLRASSALAEAVRNRTTWWQLKAADKVDTHGQTKIAELNRGAQKTLTDGLTFQYNKRLQEITQLCIQQGRAQTAAEQGELRNYLENIEKAQSLGVALTPAPTPNTSNTEHGSRSSSPNPSANNQPTAWSTPIGEKGESKVVVKDGVIDIEYFGENSQPLFVIAIEPHSTRKLTYLGGLINPNPPLAEPGYQPTIEGYSEEKYSSEWRPNVLFKDLTYYHTVVVIFGGEKLRFTDTVSTIELKNDGDSKLVLSLAYNDIPRFFSRHRNSSKFKLE